MNDIFYCKGKQLADYLVLHGSKLLRVENGSVYIFENDKTINDNLEQWEMDKKRCLF